ncbi:MAG: carboxypeptidase-like regulatory domain-containing protein, partial [Acidobacteria bacterium]|nr:carboxypeptidase-like regulatory domain-containing protein [Acidobacteriota bacterium]
MARHVVFFFMSACLALFAPAAYSQEIRASISGIVEDPSGAPIVGAKVVVTNTATGVAVSTESNTTGN